MADGAGMRVRAAPKMVNIKPRAQRPQGLLGVAIGLLIAASGATSWLLRPLHTSVHPYLGHLILR